LNITSESLAEQSAQGYHSFCRISKCWRTSTVIGNHIKAIVSIAKYVISGG